MEIKRVMMSSTLCVALSLITALGYAQATSTIVAKPGVNSTNEISVSLEKTGAAADISGYSFTVEYDMTQVDVASIKDISGQPRAGTQFSLGQETIADSGTTAAQRVILATTSSNLKNPSKLVEVKFAKKPGYAGPFYLRVSDRTSTPTVDGLLGADFKNIPHDFDVSLVNK